MRWLYNLRDRAAYAVVFAAIVVQSIVFAGAVFLIVYSVLEFAK